MGWKGLGRVGEGWGGMQIPHVGHEVIVAFLEGDPDRPLIVGRVYNSEQNVPMPLPDEKTRSVLRDYGGNETVMEGAKGKQFIHTQQTCGNEFLMDGKSGQEKIELRDKYGNEIVLDAVEKIIRIYSPTHESSIILGKSLEFGSVSDYKINIGGKEQKVVDGSKQENIVGLSSKLIGGIKQETVMGLEMKFNAVAKFEMVKAYSVKIKKSKDFETIKDARVQLDKDVLEKRESTRLWVAEKYDVGASKINDLADKIKLHGEKSIEAVAKELSWQATKLQVAAKMIIDGASCKIKSKLDAIFLKVNNSSSKQPKPVEKRKKTKASSPAMQKRKAMQQAEKAARKKNR